MKTIRRLALFFCILLVVLYVIPLLTPPDVRVITALPAITLKNDVKEWRMMGYPEPFMLSNWSRITTVFRTNFYFGGKPRHAIMKLDSPDFRGHGFLVATEDLEVFWFGTDGNVVQVAVPKRQE